MIQGQGPLVAPAWPTQGDVLINTRGAATALSGTRMDRPEDIERNPINEKVYAAFTNNTRRGVDANPGVDAANPRANNKHGHIIEIIEAGNDPGATVFQWDIFILAGDPANGVLDELGSAPIGNETTYFAGNTSSSISPLSSPDNVTFDNRGNLWIASDGLPNNLEGNDGIFAVPTAGTERGLLRQFFSAVTGAEVASLEFSKDNETLFVSVQHPGEGSTLAEPSSRFPDGGSNPPRPTVVAVTKDGGASKLIGS